MRGTHGPDRRLTRQPGRRPPLRDAVPGALRRGWPGISGELAQGRPGPVALPCPALVTEVRFAPAPGPLEAEVPESGKLLAAARLALGAAAPPG